MVKVYGNTYPHRATIKSLGLRWNPTNKEWYLVHAQQSTIETLAGLKGVVVEVNGEEYGDNRTHKQKYGRCEDAPCCGCCGTFDDRHPWNY